ncbi:MAG TPA: hypothetical protein EYP40_05220 [Chromatiales bacterium]|nr:hypothetical protein [Chromatiales bacterium]
MIPLQGRFRFKMVLFLVFTGLLFSETGAAEITTLSSAINKAGRQRMLTQRMLKAYAMIGIEVLTEKSRQQLQASIRLYDRQLAELKNFAPNRKIQSSLDKVETLWIPYKKMLLQPVSRENAALLLETNDELLAASHKVVMQLEEVSGTGFGRLVNISGRQRMLSQRLAKFYMLRAWGFDNAEMRAESQRAKSEFKGAMQELREAGENTPRIQQALEKASAQWELFEHGLERNQQTLVPLIVAMTSEQVLVSMNRITGMYEALSAR